MLRDSLCKLGAVLIACGEAEEKKHSIPGIS